ncbi:MAG TPA: FliM/FliN family flagellar motor C-terminal domain-containing protein [Bryobacteraceae bacterium]|nr:FliM/FliN family flagellar motor C-terminal domain-containing protein [Bryobacteraceae bacterium]
MASPDQLARYAQVPLSVESELGQCTMSVRDILSLAPGSVVKLSRPLASKVDLLVGGSPFGSGELVRVGGSIAVRITNFAVKQPG